MSGELQPASPSALAAVDPLHEEVARNLAAARAVSTWAAYRSDWDNFARWCHGHGAASKPADESTVAAYISDLAREGDGRVPLSPSTISRRLAAIRAAHEMAGFTSPTLHPLVVKTRQGIGRRLREAPRHRKRAISTDDLRAASMAMGGRLIDLRDRALLLVGYAGGLRRSELVALDVADVEQRPEGLDVTIRRSKADQEGRGAAIGIVYGTDRYTCPVRALRAWLDAAGLADGAVFRRMGKGDRVLGRMSGHSVALVVKRHMGPLGRDVGEFSGHSLRRGMATTAARNGADDRKIMATTRHAKADSLTPYIEDGNRLVDPASGYLGL